LRCILRHCGVLVVRLISQDWRALPANFFQNHLNKDDGFVKSSDAALRCILRHCGVLVVRLISQDWRALPANFFQNHLNFAFLRFYQGCDSCFEYGGWYGWLSL
jgi:hypothetical protein